MTKFKSETKAKSLKTLRTGLAALTVSLISGMAAQAQVENIHASNLTIQDNSHEALEILNFKFDPKGIDDKSVVLLKTQAEIKKINEVSRFEAARSDITNKDNFLRNIQRKNATRGNKVTSEFSKGYSQELSHSDYASAEINPNLQKFLPRNLVSLKKDPKVVRFAADTSWFIKPEVQQYARIETTESYGSTLGTMQLP